MATINADGITIKTVLEWKEMIEAIYLAVDPNWSLEPDTLDGQVIATLAEMLANQDEGELDSYNAADPDKATGQGLTAIMAHHNIQRDEPTYSTARLSLYGDLGTVIQVGTQFRDTVKNIIWESVYPYTMNGVGGESIPIRCTEPGPIAPVFGHINEVVNPISGLNTVFNPVDGLVVGRDPLNDAEAREYRKDLIAKNSFGGADSIRAAVLEVSYVGQCRVYNNRADAADANGIPAHFMAIVVAPQSFITPIPDQVAAAVYSKLSPGVGMHSGSNPITRYHYSPNSPNAENITYNLAVDVDLFIEVRINQTGIFESDAADQIKQNILAFANGTLFDEDEETNNRRTPFQIGEDISSGMLFTPVNYYLGQSGQGYATDIYISNAANPNAPGVVAVSWQSIARVDVANINVVIS